MTACTAPQIYRSFDIGKLVKLIMLDTRVIGRYLQNAAAANVSPACLTAAHQHKCRSRMAAAQDEHDTTAASADVQA